MHALLVIGLATVCISIVHADCPTDCVNQAKAAIASENQQSNPTSYCVNASFAIAQAIQCLAVSCNNAQDTSGYISTTKTQIDNFCRTKDPLCTSTTDISVNQAACWNPYGTLPLVLAAIGSNFQSKNDSTSACNQLYWGRTCQTKISNCTYTNALQLKFVASNPSVVLGLALCGSETVGTLAPLAYRSDGCNNNIDSNVRDNCNIGYKVATATNASTICALFQQQITCLENACAGCSVAEAQYILPRMDTYAIANLYLKCNIQYKGVSLQQRFASACQYSVVLNACFFQTTVENALDFGRLQPLFNKDLPINGFCTNLKNIAAQQATCNAALMTCVIPQSKMYVSPGIYDNSYAPEIGGYPLNLWGMASIFNDLNGSCPQGSQWSNQLYAPTVVATQPTAGRVTPPPKTTPVPPKQPIPNPTPTSRNPNVVGNLALSTNVGT